MNLNSKYNRDLFISFLEKDFLPNFSKDIRDIDHAGKIKTIKDAKYIGECSELDLQVFEIETEGKSEKKVSQALDSFKMLKGYQAYNALVVYFSKDDRNWRLALLQMTLVKSKTGKITQEYSNPRRYSFLLGPDAKTKTPEKYLIKNGKIKDFEDLQSRFSVEVVNKDFYQEIARFFSRLVGGKTKLKAKTEKFESELVLPSAGSNKHQLYQEFAVRLIGRVIFCWFLKQKKSDKNVSLLPEEFLSSKAVKDNKSYYHSVLEPIFFEVLNKPKEMRKSQFRNGYDKIPYLNGGLFDPHLEDYYEGMPNYGLKIPDKWFRELFEILETYNFTIDENTALDVDLSIDPEMLGRIFENLLAEINPETGASARKSTGSYYTPRQIVEYMVDQSLGQYLITKTGVQKEKIEALITIDASDDKLYPLNSSDRKKIVDALDKVKIIDPACGSGAFPIGILQKIVWILGLIDKDGKLWFEKKLENLDSILHEDLKQKFENENFDYIRKTGVIKDSIYGVDIQSIAVEVSKLRCFLTLIVDEDIDEKKDNRGIKPLPNLEFKFVAANSLISLPNSSDSNNGQTSMFEEDQEIEQLKKLRDLYFISNGFEKERIKNRFKDIQREMFKKQINKGGHGRLTMALADWDPFSNKSLKWFDPEWMFGIKIFDIVIANPPYYRSRDLTKDLVSMYSNKFKLVKSGFDLATLFVELADNLIGASGIISFIITNKIFSARYAIKLREYLIKNNRIQQVINLYSNLFENTPIETSVIILTENNESILYNNYLSKDSLEGNIIEVSKSIKTKTFSKLPNKIFIFPKTNAEVVLLNKLLTYNNKISDFFKLKAGHGITGIRNDLHKSKQDSQDLPVFSGKCIWKYKNLDAEYFTKRKDLENILENCALIRELSTKNRSTLIRDLRHGVALNSITIVKQKLANVPIALFVSIFNSTIFEKIYSLFYESTRTHSNLRFKAIYIDDIPIPDLTIFNNSQLINLVYKLVDSQEKNDKILKMIDQIINKIYNLTPEEIKIVEESTKRK